MSVPPGPVCSPPLGCALCFGGFILELTGFAHSKVDTKLEILQRQTDLVFTSGDPLPRVHAENCHNVKERKIITVELKGK